MNKYIILFLIVFLSTNVSTFAYDEQEDALKIMAINYIKKAGDDPLNEKAFEECVTKLSEKDWRHGFDICSGIEVDRLKNIMNNTYSKIMRSNIEFDKKKLIENAQKSWISYRKQFENIHESYIYSVAQYNAHSKFVINLFRSQAIILSDVYEEIKGYIEEHE